MSFKDLREFINYLEVVGELKRISHPVDPHYEMTEISDRTLRNEGPALLFENPKGYDYPVLTNLFGSPKRVAMGMGQKDVRALRKVGTLLSYLKEPEPPSSLKDAINKLPIFKQVLSMPTKGVKKAPCQQIVWQGDDVDLDKLPIMSCWQGDVAPLLTWGLTITKGPNKKRQNLGIYRQQKLTKNKIIMRWLAHRGGALDFKDWLQENPGKPFPVSVAFGADPATIIGAVTPVPDTLSEYAFAGLLRGKRTEVTSSISNSLQVPANSEIVLEGYIDPNEMADEGPYGDHTGYYNEVEKHHVMTVTHITMRENPIYHSTYTGRPPDEPAVLGEALNEVFIPILQKQFPEIVDFYLPPEGCSYRLAIVTIDKQYAGHAKRIMMGVWSFLRQFMYTKYVIVCDEKVNAREWQDVIGAWVHNTIPEQDCLFIDNTPIDSLDFASPIIGLGSKMGIDATQKWHEEPQPTNSTCISTAELKGAFSRIAPEITRLHFPEVAHGAFVIASLKKKSAQQARAILNQLFSSPVIKKRVKYIILCDDDIDIRNWNDVIWAITTRMDPKKDTLKNGLLALDATNKFKEERTREWGVPIKKDAALVSRIDGIWDELGIS